MKRLPLLAPWAMLLPVLVPGGVTAYAQIPAGTVMVSTGNGRVTEYTQNGTFVAQLDTTTAAFEITGSAFDSAGNFYVTDFTAQQVTKFDPTGALIGPFGSGYNADPESIAFDGAGNVYVGQADGTREVLKFDPSGIPLATFSPATEGRGTDWIDLAADQCTMFYTSEGVQLKRFDVCTNTQLADFNVAPLPGSVAYAHRVRPNGEVLVGDSELVVRLDSVGNQIQMYILPGTTVLFAVNLDPDGTSFWTADAFSGEVFKVDIASGAILQQWSAAGAPNFVDVGGLSIKGEIAVAVPTNTPTPEESPTDTPTFTPTPTLSPTPTPINKPPICSAASSSTSTLWPPNHMLVSVSVTGVFDPDGDAVTTTITGVTQDEPLKGLGSDATCPDAFGVGTPAAQLRAERDGTADGRVYHLSFTATDSAGKSCTGVVTVCVPHDQSGRTCVDEGPLFNSTGPC